MTNLELLKADLLNLDKIIHALRREVFAEVLETLIRVREMIIKQIEEESE